MKNKNEFQSIPRKLNILLAEDDSDDRLLFEEALEELPLTFQLTTVYNGEELIEWLTRQGNNLPDVLFLDLNMPRKNGFAVLGEIKRNNNLQDLPVIIFSTANNVEMTKQVFKDAAHYYIRKPIDFQNLKALIYKALKLIADNNTPLPDRDNFVLTID